MNDFFNGKRFLGYAVKHYTENKRFYAIGLAGLALLLLALNFYIDHQYRDRPEIGAVYLVPQFAVALLSMILVAQAGFRDYRKRAERDMAFTLPVSNFEKYLFGGLNPLLFIGIVFPLLLWICRLPFWGASWSFLRFIDLETGLFILVVHGGMLLANAAAKKDVRLAYLVVAAAYFAYPLFFYLPVLLGWVNDGARFLLPPYYMMSPLFIEGDSSIHLSVSLLSPECQKITKLLFLVSLALFFWVTGYFKFRERQLK